MAARYDGCLYLAELRDGFTPAGRSLVSGTGRGRRRNTRKHKVNSRTFAGFTIEMKPAAQVTCNDGMDDMQAEAGVAAIATCREERIEGFAPDLKVHAAAIVGKKDFDSVATGSLDLDVYNTSLAIRKSVRDRIEEKVC